FAMADGQTPKVKFFGALVRAVLLARRLRKHWHGQEMVGILLPPSVPGALVNLAAMLMGRIPVNLNYTASHETLASCAVQCGLQTVVTPRVSPEKPRFQPPAEAIYIEDVAQPPGLGERLGAVAAALVLPARSLMKHAGCERLPSVDDIATIIFS